ncbi:condensation domain-containing protein [Micromonospora sp. WMMD1082]|uniref:condensation domain-containing protein n=1 Tax=Micromonospora sp. WMMD1082 TaxID=3016104 RepID=UPI002416A5AC|nr:condensation domain-containing protein [Micromonospora sp. WMMD1082]MDG4797013.1 condensation domain-containing protein [Micromonospora sp. WMMD1082]
MTTESDAEAIQRRFAHLPAERRRALERVLRARAEPPRSAAPLAPRADPDAPVPLSYAQERLWYLEQLYQRRDIFAFPTASRLRGPLDLTALRSACADLAARHDSLRTVVTTVDGAPTQRILPVRTVDFELVDLTGADPATCAERASAEALTGFDLATQPPLRVRVYRLAADDHVLVVNQHVAVADMPSRAILLRDLWNRYEAAAYGSAPPLPTLPIQYADFAVWQRDRLDGERLDRLLDYWQRHLADAPHKLAMPTTRPRPARHEGSGRFYYGTAPEGLGERVHEAARSWRTTPSVLLLACYRILLWQYSGQEDIVVGVPKSERAHPETENLIGYFVNVLPLRSQVRDTDTARQVIAREHTRALAAYARQELPYERVVRAVNPVREAGVPPLYQVSYSYLADAGPGLPLSPSGLRGEPFPLRSEGTEYDLGVNILHGVRLGAQWPYNDDIFDESTVETLAGQFWALVAAVVADVDTPVTALPVTSTGHDGTAPSTTGAKPPHTPGDAAPRATIPAAAALVGPVGRLLSTAPPGSALADVDAGLADATGAELTRVPGGGTDLAALVDRLRPGLVSATTALLARLPAGWRAPDGCALLAVGDLHRAAAERLAARAGLVWYGCLRPGGGLATLGRLSVGRERVGAGRPLAPLRAWTAHPSGRPLPQGAFGTLHLRAADGPGPAEPTDWYARLRADDTVELAGPAADRTVLRGVPLHPSEITDLLVQLPGVRDATTVTTPDGTPHAYLVLAETVDPEQVRQWLGQRLPSFAVPGLTVLPGLPHTVDGRVDRAALPTPTTDGGSDSRPPSGPTEQVIAGAWTELLGRAPAYVDDNFFDLGGHSLMLQQLSARLSQVLGGPVPLIELLEHPTVAQQAQLVGELGLAGEPA